MSGHESQRPDCITIYKVSQLDPSRNPDLSRKLASTRTQTTSETGYMMRFDEPACLSLNVFDVVEMPGESYPVPESALESLPAHIQAELEREGVVQLEGRYDSSRGEFNGPELHADDKPFPVRAAELMELEGVSFLQAADYITVVEREIVERDQWQAVRDLSNSGMNKSIRGVEKALAGTSPPGTEEEVSESASTPTRDSASEDEIQSPIPSKSEE